MNLIEYEAKKILSDADVTVPMSELVAASARAEVPNFALPVVVKSQVPTGGRGKLGGIRVVSNAKELQSAVDAISKLPIKGYLPNKLLVEKALDITHEYYLSLMINRSLACIELSAHRGGGVDIESHQSSEFLRRALHPRSLDTAGQIIAEYFELESHAFALQDLVENLYRCFVQNDATLLEINPLILTTDTQLVAGDCKMILDDAAAFRHPEWDFEEKPASANFVTLDPTGTVATIANGAGLAMATVDAVTAAGHAPANFLDIGGNATTEQIVASFQKIMEFPQIEAIVINIFGGIVRCDTVAQAIIEAKAEVTKLPRLIIRLSGNHSEGAAELLAQHHLPLYSDLTACIEALAS